MSNFQVGDILQNQTDYHVCCVAPGEAVEVTKVAPNGCADITFVGSEATCYLYRNEVARLTKMVEEPEDENPIVTVLLTEAGISIHGSPDAVAATVLALKAG